MNIPNGFIRAATEDDAPSILRIYAPIVANTPISFEIEVPSVVEISSRIQKTLTHFPWLVYQVQDEVIAYAYAGAHRARPAYQWSTEVTVYVDNRHHHQGIGKMLYEALFETLREQGYRNAIAGITLPNPSSVGIHESMGFKQVALFKELGFKHGAWHDVGFWQLKLQELSDNPAPPGRRR